MTTAKVIHDGLMPDEEPYAAGIVEGLEMAARIAEAYPAYHADHDQLPAGKKIAHDIAIAIRREKRGEKALLDKAPLPSNGGG